MIKLTRLLAVTLLRVIYKLTSSALAVYTHQHHHHHPPTRLTFLPDVRSEHVRTLFDTTQTQEFKSEHVTKEYNIWCGYHGYHGYMTLSSELKGKHALLNISDFKKKRL